MFCQKCIYQVYDFLASASAKYGDCYFVEVGTKISLQGWVFGSQAAGLSTKLFWKTTPSRVLIFMSVIFVYVDRF